MTEASAMEAGAELDRRVARILGWRHRDPPNMSSESWYPPWPEDDPPQGKAWMQLGREDPPEFSVSHEAAARIKQHLRERIPFEVLHGDMIRCIYVPPEPGSYSHVQGIAESEPLALCRFLVRLDEEDVI